MFPRNLPVVLLLILLHSSNSGLALYGHLPVVSPILVLLLFYYNKYNQQNILVPNYVFYRILLLSFLFQKIYFEEKIHKTMHLDKQVPRNRNQVLYELPYKHLLSFWSDLHITYLHPFFIRSLLVRHVCAEQIRWYFCLLSFLFTTGFAHLYEVGSEQ